MYATIYNEYVIHFGSSVLSQYFIVYFVGREFERFFIQFIINIINNPSLTQQQFS